MVDRLIGVFSSEVRGATERSPRSEWLSAPERFKTDPTFSEL
jgi:hypothetical protein